MSNAFSRSPAPSKLNVLKKALDSKKFLKAKLFLNLVPKKTLVFHVKNAKIGFVEIVSQKVLNKIIHFIVQTLNF
ncbi:hypothetical protein BpHYR1_000545 [Brachionus plicatilis]|uniref:Uncharacterized protein n=1 Tax=Brachionus plicatilis TaxID=10195 RepID=A0A3M7S7U5_BRAPC|nr:hypothetical protein BpHYR1_000545 [Brachionus plicatilis]